MYLLRGIILLNSVYHILNVTTVDIVLNFVRTFVVHKTIIVNSSVYLYTTDFPLLETFFDGQNGKYVLLTVTYYYLQLRKFLKQIRFFGDIFSTWHDDANKSKHLYYSNTRCTILNNFEKQLFKYENAILFIKFMD